MTKKGQDVALNKLLNIRIRQHSHERSSTSTKFHDLETVSKSMRFVSIYTEPFSPENQSRDGISDPSTTC